MRILIIAGLTAISLTACSQGSEKKAESGAPAQSQAAALGLPTGPTPGLWRITSQIEGMPAGMAAHGVETCVREAKFEMPSGPTASGSGMNCSEQSFRREGDAVVGHSVCTMPDGVRTVTDTRMSGDFTKHYTMQVKATTTPAPTPAMAEMNMTMTAERVGDCPAGATP